MTPTGMNSVNVIGLVLAVSAILAYIWYMKFKAWRYDRDELPDNDYDGEERERALAMDASDFGYIMCLTFVIGGILMLVLTALRGG